MSDKKTSSLSLFWEGLSPNHKRLLAIVAILSGVFILMAFLTGGGEGVVKKNTTSLKRSVLSDVNTRSIGIDALHVHVKTVVKENHNLKAKVKSMENEIRDIKRRRGNNPDMTRQLTALQSQVANIKRKAQSIGWDVEDIKDGYLDAPESDLPENVFNAQEGVHNKKTQPTLASVAKASVIEKKATVKVEQGLHQDPNYYFRSSPVRQMTPGPKTGSSNNNKESNKGNLKIYITESKPLKTLADKKEPAVTLPAGTILTGVLLNGLDAATGKQARKNPFPVVVRIQHDAIMPNLYSADIKECFATLSGYGDLSSERAYLRGEKLSCITEKEEIIEVKLPSYAVGEDGKAGMRGRLVSKEGTLIAKTALAGFLGGVAEAFGGTPIPTIQTSPGNTPLFQDNLSSETVSYGIGKGASAVAERLADYYMNMADQIFPVVEIDAGRKIDIIITNGIKLVTKEK